MPSRKILIGLTILGAAGALSGCAMAERDHVYAQSLGLQCSQTGGLVARLACNNRAPSDKTEKVSRYCYDTLGDANCFDRPDQDRKNQALGSSGY